MGSCHSTYSRTSRSGGSTPTMASKWRSSCSSGRSYSTGSRAIRQMDGRSGATKAQRQRACSAPALMWVAPSADSRIGSTAKRRRLSERLGRACALQQFLQITGAIQAVQWSSSASTRVVAGVASPRSQWIHTAAPTSTTSHFTPNRAHVAVKQVAPGQRHQFALSPTREQLARRPGSTAEAERAVTASLRIRRPSTNDPEHGLRNDGTER